MSDFFSGGWSVFIAASTVLGLIACVARLIIAARRRVVGTVDDNEMVFVGTGAGLVGGAMLGAGVASSSSLISGLLASNVTPSLQVFACHCANSCCCWRKAASSSAV